MSIACLNPFWIWKTIICILQLKSRIAKLLYYVFPEKSFHKVLINCKDWELSSSRREIVVFFFCRKLHLSKLSLQFITRAFIEDMIIWLSVQRISRYNMSNVSETSILAGWLSSVIVHGNTCNFPKTPVSWRLFSEISSETKQFFFSQGDRLISFNFHWAACCDLDEIT